MAAERDVRELLEKLAHRPAASWVLEILNRYHQTGTIRRKDLHRLLGSQADNDALREAVLKAMQGTSQQSCAAAAIRPQSH
jgi:hypothetical protein